MNEDDDIVYAMMQTGHSAKKIREARQAERDRMADLGLAVDDDPLFAQSHDKMTVRMWNDLVARVRALEARQ